MQLNDTGLLRGTWREGWLDVTFAWLSALRCASMEGCNERPSMLFACGSEESEHARLGSAMSCSGGMLLLEDAEESDFCVWDGMGAWVTGKWGRRR